MAKNPRLIDLAGQQFGQLKVLAQQGNTPRGGALWKCLCACGNSTVSHGADLRKGKSKSCGHDRDERIASLRRTHGATGTRLYQIWKNMKARCLDKTNEHYGAKGIEVCDLWQNFEPFQAWAVENGYSDDLTIDRLNNDLGYSPGNCTWSDKIQQSVNRRFVQKNTDGIPWWHVAKKNGISQGAYRTRLFDGWSHEEAATAPMHKKRPDKMLPRDSEGKFRPRQ